MEKNSNKFFRYINLTKIDKLNPADFKNLIKTIKPLKDYSASYKDLGKNERDQLFELKFNKLLQPLLQSIQKRREEVQAYLDFIPYKEINRINKKYWSNLREAKDIFSIGHSGTAVFLIGKTLENVIRDYLIKLNTTKKIKYSSKEIRNWDFESMINIIAKERKITPSRKSKILAVKWDRNIFGHPSQQKKIIEALKDSKSIIILRINQIILFDKEIKRS